MDKEARKERQREIKKRYNQAHKEQVRERKKNYYQAHKEQVNERHRIYYQAHKEQINERSRQYYLSHKEQVLKYDRQWAKDNSQRVRHNSLKWRYNISLEEWEALYQIQQGQCAICHKPFKSKKGAHTDHNHETNEVRGLICNNCNTGIGQLKESKEILKQAIAYLEGRPSLVDIALTLEG